MDGTYWNFRPIARKKENAKNFGPSPNFSNLSRMYAPIRLQMCPKVSFRKYLPGTTVESPRALQHPDQIFVGNLAIPHFGLVSSHLPCSCVRHLSKVARHP